MNFRETAKLWQLGIAAGILFGFGSNALEVFVPPPVRFYLKPALLVISGFLILAGYAHLRKMNGIGVPSLKEAHTADLE